MGNDQGQDSLYRRWNPEKLDDICGNTLAVTKCRSLIGMAPSKRPGFILISGDYGTGKSTLAHILAAEFGCGDKRVFNSRECGKVDFVTDFLTNELPARSLMSASRMFIFEEAHNITAAAQEMFMEPLEKGIPPQTYVVFVTNAPEKLTGGKGALLSRPFRIETTPVKAEDMVPRLAQIALGEGLTVSSEHLRLCAEYANRSVRAAINNLSVLASVPEAMRGEELERIRLNADTGNADIPQKIIDLAKAVETGSWGTVAEVLASMREAGEDPEGLRRGLLAFYGGVMLSAKPFCRKKRAFARNVLVTLSDNYYNVGFAGLVRDLSHIAEGGI